MADFTITVNDTLDLNYHADGQPADQGVTYVMSESSKAIADFDAASGLITPKAPGTLLIDVIDTATKAPVAEVIVDVQGTKEAQLEADIQAGVKKFVRDFVKAAKTPPVDPNAPQFSAAVEIDPNFGPGPNFMWANMPTEFDLDGNHYVADRWWIHDPNGGMFGGVGSVNAGASGVHSELLNVHGTYEFRIAKGFQESEPIKTFVY